MTNKEPESGVKLRFFNVSLVNGNIMSTPRLEQPQRLVGELIHSIEAASPKFAWIQFLFRSANLTSALIGLKNSIHAATEQIKRPRLSPIDGSEHDRTELHRDWYRKAGERTKAIDAITYRPHVLLAIQGMWVGDPRQLSFLPFRDCCDDHDRLGVFVYRNPWILAELVERRMVEDIFPYIRSYASSRLEPPSFLTTPDQMPYYVHLPIAKEMESLPSVSFKQYSPVTREGGVEGAARKEDAAPSRVLTLTKVPLVTDQLKEKETERLSLLPSPTVRSFEIIFSGGKTELLLSSRSDLDVKQYVSVIESVYGELNTAETPAKPLFLSSLPRMVGLEGPTAGSAR